MFEVVGDFEAELEVGIFKTEPTAIMFGFVICGFALRISENLADDPKNLAAIVPSVSPSLTV